MSDPAVVFMFGLPRSGTKLTRELLNGHPDIAIFPHESHFIPYFARAFDRFGDVMQRQGFDRFHSEFARTTFARRMAARGIEFEASRWFGMLQGPQYGDVLRALFRLYSEMTGCRVVGDKTPGYVSQVGLLATLFPHAKYVHVMRDPRDYACSIREAWGKSIPRAVQRWKQQIRTYYSDVSDHSVDHMELSYEGLLANPERTMQRLCAFLGVEFHREMLVLDRPAENLASTRDSVTIVSDNAGRWAQKLSNREVAMIEKICGDLMSSLGYQPKHAPGDENLGTARMTWHRLLDGLNLLRFQFRNEPRVLAALAEMGRAMKYRDTDD